MSAPSEEIHILHVDDERDFSETAAEFLERQDERFDIESATNAREALDKLHENDFHCVVSDFDMPGQDGIEFLEAVREDYPDLPFILYTGKGSEEVASDAISAGVTEYLQKEGGSSQYTVLANRIRNSVEQYRARTELAERERRLDLFFEQSPLGVIRWDDGFNFARLNDTAREILGYDEGELVGQPWNVVVPEDDREEIGEVVVSGLLADEGGYHSINENIRKDGERIVCEWHNWVVTDDDDEVVAVFSQFEDITERKAREAEMQRQRAETTALQERLERALAATDTYVWEWDLETDEIERYPAPDSLFELSSGDLGPVFGGWLERVHPEDRPTIERTITEGIEAGSGYQFECRFETDDGYRWIRDRAVVETEDGEPVRAIGSVTDVTEQMEREQTLTRLVQQLGDLIDTTTGEETCRVAIDIAARVLEAPLVGFHLVSVDGVRLEAVAARDDVRDEFGVPPTYDREGAGTAAELVWDAFEAGESTYVDDTRNHGTLAEETPASSGVIHPIDDHGVFIASTTDLDGFDETDRAFTELLAQAVTAVLDRVEREDRLREHNRQLERLHDVGQEIIQADTPDEIAERLVAGARSILSYPITMVRYYEESAGGLVPVASTEQVDHVFEARPTFTPEGESLNWSVYESGSPAVFDDIDDIDRAVDRDTPLQSLMILPLGDHGTLSVGSTTPESFDESDVSLAQLLVTTAEQALSNLERERELIRQRDELSRQNERLDEFASVVSHDLRNPLNVAHGRLELASEDCESEHLDAVARAHDRMETLIDDMLSLASVGESVGATEPVELPELVDTCWRNVETDTAKLVTETDALIQADKTRLQQLLENLLRNGVEHGGSRVTITVGDLPGGFYVEDDGPGIPPEERDRVFDPGYTTLTEGTGFGLSIVRDIAQAHGWVVSLSESAEGGARFEVSNVVTE